MSRPPKYPFVKRSKGQPRCPQTIRQDGYAAPRRAVREQKADGSLPADAKLRSSRYLNNRIERGLSGREAAHCRDARLQGLRECSNHDRRHRAAAPHPEGTVQTRSSGVQGRTAPAVWNAGFGPEICTAKQGEIARAD